MTNEQLIQLARELHTRYHYTADDVPQGTDKVVVVTPAGAQIELALLPEAGRWSEYRYLSAKWLNAPSDYKPRHAWHGLLEEETVFPESVESAIRTSLTNPRSYFL